MGSVTLNIQFGTCYKMNIIDTTLHCQGKQFQLTILKFVSWKEHSKFKLV